MHVDRPGVEALAPRHIWKRGGQWNGSIRRASQVHGRGGFTDAGRSEVVVKAIEQQAQASARADFEQRQRSRWQRREQDGAAPDFVGLRAARSHHVAKLASASL